MPTYTTNYNLNKPNVNSADDEDRWGGQLNDNMDTIDTQLKNNADAAQPASATKTADYTLVAADQGKTILIDASGGNVTIEPDATLKDGFDVTFVRTDNSANTVTIAPTGSQTINGDLTYTLDSQYSRLSIVGNGSNFFITSKDTPFASGAETLTGTETSKAVTPAGFASDIDVSTDGFYKFPGGLIMQWGKYNAGSGFNARITFPEAFPTALFTVLASTDYGGSLTITQIDTQDTTGFNIKQERTTDGSNQDVGAFWVAFGN